MWLDKHGKPVCFISQPYCNHWEARPEDAKRHYDELDALASQYGFYIRESRNESWHKPGRTTLFEIWKDRETFERCKKGGKIMTPANRDLRSWPEFQREYPASVNLVREVYRTGEGKAVTCDNALEPGQCVIYAYPETAAMVRYEEYHETENPDDVLTNPNAVPDVSLRVIFGLKFDLGERRQ